MRSNRKISLFIFFTIASARKKVILWVIVPRQQEAFIMFDGQKLSANDEEDMEDFQDYDDEEHPDLTSKLDEFEDEEEEEVVVVAAIEVAPPAPAPGGPPPDAAAAPKKPAKKATQAAARKAPAK